MYINHAPLIHTITLQQKFGEALKQWEMPGPYFSQGKLSNQVFLDDTLIDSKLKPSGNFIKFHCECLIVSNG